ncbi:hypothetical protein Fcan01_25464 [Folsomia candida]|uniref:Uncharacterized protein n=1 Tax=Folsomia candida TaxID=158441 RepID=A0A226D4S8_FOLCA|nr:hypothetical protein Fcan01_25464 [Folsomia candida]
MKILKLVISLLLYNVLLATRTSSMAQTLEIYSALKPFANCTTTVITMNNDSITNIKLTMTPIIFITEPILSSRWEKLIPGRFSLLHRRNKIKHCWATLLILPKFWNILSFNSQFYSHWSDHFYYIRTVENHYFLVASVTGSITGKELVKTYTTQFRSTSYYSRMEVILVNLFPTRVTEKVGVITMEYLNMFYLFHYQVSPGMDIALTKASFNISCKTDKEHLCFEQLTRISMIVTNLNKYFWIVEHSHEQLLSIFSNNTTQEPTAIAAVRRVQSFNDLVAFWILQDVPLSNSFYRCFFLRPQANNGFFAYDGDSFKLHKVDNYYFISCYKVRQDSSLLNALSTPFGNSAWICFVTSFLAVTIFLSASQKKFGSAGFRLAVGIMLESSVLYLLKFPKKYEISLVVGIWIVLAGTLLTNWYKTAFTIEMIVPITHGAPWNGLLNIEGVKVLMPLRLMTANVREDFPHSFYVQLFFAGIQNRALPFVEWFSHNKRLKSYFRMAQFLVNLMPLSYQIMDQPLNSIELESVPIQPILYTEITNLIKHLSSCDKTGFLDEKENVAAVLPFLNDNSDGITYMIGEDKFFTKFLGWPVSPVVRDYTIRRLDVMLTSGIYGYWEGLYKLVRPKKLFHHYANWTHPRLPKVAKLNFNSKIVTAFYICGGCLAVCGIFLVGEIICMLCQKWFNSISICKIR